MHSIAHLGYIDHHLTQNNQQHTPSRNDECASILPVLHFCFTLQRNDVKTRSKTANDN